jgi:hypothetical protein
MPLSRLQKTVLERYKQFKDQPPTMWQLMSLSVINHAGLVMVTAAGMAILIASEIPYVAWFFAGIMLGAFSRDLGTFRRLLQIWPVLLFVFDWSKIDDLLAGKIEVSNIS